MQEEGEAGDQQQKGHEAQFLADARERHVRMEGGHQIRIAFPESLARKAACSQPPDALDDLVTTTRNIVIPQIFSDLLSVQQPLSLILHAHLDQDASARHECKEKEVEEDGALIQAA